MFVAAKKKKKNANQKLKKKYAKWPKRKNWERHPAAGATIKGSEEEALFGMLPNELLENIQVLYNTWIHCGILCVCKRWRFLLLNQGGTPFSRTVSFFAAELAREGHLKVLQWARSQGCPWNVWTCNNAAAGGHLLKWARSQGCPWDERICANAAAWGHLEVLEWARSQGCPMGCEDMCPCCSWRPLKWARSQGCPEGKTFSLSKGKHSLGNLRAGYHHELNGPNGFLIWI